MRKKTRVLLILVLVLLLCTAGAYFAIGVHYSTHFFRQTSINGVDVSECTAAEAQERIAREADAYRLVLTGRNLAGGEADQETIQGSSFDYHFVFDGEVEALLAEQSPYLWLPVYFAGERRLSVDTAAAYDEEKLDAAVASLKCMQTNQMVAPENAYLARLEDGSYEIVPETMGTRLDPDRTEEAVRTAVDDARKSLNLETADCYAEAEVTARDPALIKERDLRNHYASMVINYYMSGDVVVTLNSSTFMEWFSFDGEDTVDFDYASVQAWVNELADTYDTIGTREPFETSHQLTVEVEAVTYGWQMDREAETEALYHLLLSGETEGRSPVWLESAYTRGQNDVGDTYVEVDYTNQHMWYYKEGKLLVETPVVTGNVSAGNGSPEGMYSIFMKERNATLEGEGYQTPVNYWMPFFGNVGIHDADSWRSSYGGTIYQSGGSHGCINTPTAQAAAIYEEIEVGTPVICYSSGVDYGYPESSEGTNYAEGTEVETDAASAEGGAFDIVISDESVWQDGSSVPDTGNLEAEGEEIRIE